MKKLIRPAIFSLFLISVCAFTTSDKWYLFESAPFGFKIEFPSKPIEKSKPINTAAGEVTMNMIEYIPTKETADLNLAYMVSYIEYPAEIDANDKEKQKQLCRKTVDGVATRISGKVMKETPTMLDGYEGVEARIEYKENTQVLKMRLYVVKNKTYLIETASLIAKDNNASVQKFLNSFKLLK